MGSERKGSGKRQLRMLMERELRRPGLAAPPPPHTPDLLGHTPLTPSHPAPPGCDGWPGAEKARCKSPICSLLGSLGSAAG